MMQYSFDSAPPRLHASVAGNAEPISSTECLFRVASTGRTHVLPIPAVEALDRCRAFAPLAEHVANLAEMQPQARAAIDQGMQALVQQGLMIDHVAWLASFTSAGVAPATSPALGGVFIRACDRPRQLEALLESLRGNERAHAPKHRYVVLDDSRDAALASENASLLARFGDAAGVRVDYVGSERWRALVDRLVAELPEHADAIRFGLSRDLTTGPRFGGGKGYNLATLLGAGAPFALLDDDFRLPLRVRDGVRALSLTEDVPEHVVFHDDLAQALDDGTAIEGDAFAYGLAHCGRTLAATFAASSALAPTPETLYGFAPSLAPHIRPDARIASVGLGHRGHSGTQSSRWMYFVAPASRAALWRDEASYRRHLEGQALWHGPAQPRLQPFAVFTPFVLDGTRALPPTMPGGRNEDLLYGVLLNALDPSAISLQLPATMGHVQESQRSRTAQLREAATPVTNQFVVELIRAAAPELRAAPGPARHRALANVLRDTADASASARIELIENYLRHARANMAARLAETLASAPDAPSWWRRDLEQMIATHRRALVEEAAPRFSDWSEDAALGDRLRETLVGLANLVEAWPALYARGGVALA